LDVCFHHEDLHEISAVAAIEDMRHDVLELDLDGQPLHVRDLAVDLREDLAD
jgi:hypothetical protein